jgi:hypothetical protein
MDRSKERCKVGRRSPYIETAFPSSLRKSPLLISPLVGAQVCRHHGISSSKYLRLWRRSWKYDISMLGFLALTQGHGSSVVMSAQGLLMAAQMLVNGG